MLRVAYEKIDSPGAGTMAAKAKAISVVRMSRYCVLEMLRIEEVLLRKSDRSWCLINDGIQKPAVVMGISG